MGTFLARCLVLGLAATLASVRPAWAQSAQVDENRSNYAQPDNQTTSAPQQDANQPSSQQNDPQTGQNWQQSQSTQPGQGGQDDSRQGFLGRRDADQQTRREERQDQRQDRRQEGGLFGRRDRQPAIGVTVVERGGMGVRVMAVVPNSPASQSGIRPGDTILEVEGRQVGTAQQLVELIQQQEAGDTAEFAVIREGREYQVPVRLSTREEALPARLRPQDGSQDQRGQQFGQSSQSWQQGGQDQSWQQGQYDDQSQQFGQQQRQYDQGRQASQQGQSGFGPPQPPSPYTGAYNQETGPTRQAFYGGQSSDYSRQSQYSQDSQRQPIGERLAQRLTQFEQRLDRIAQRLDQIERIRSQAGSTDSTQTSPSQQTGSSPSSVDEDQSDDDHDSEDNPQNQQ